jgi:hypothetical protein
MDIWKFAPAIEERDSEECKENGGTFRGKRVCKWSGQTDKGPVILDFDDCLDVLYRQTVCLKDITAVQKTVRDAVFERNWTVLEPALSQAEELGTQLSELEIERSAVFGGRSFREALSTFDVEESAALMSARRDLKHAACKVRVGTEALNGYLSEVHIVIRGFLDAAFPERRDRVYSREGRRKKTELRNVVLDKVI